MKIIRSPFVQDIEKDCLDILRDWKNVSCMFYPYDIDNVISRYLNPDGSSTMKVAKPPIYTSDISFYWFVQGSPFAIKFHEVMQRIEETKLMQLPAFVYENPNILTVDENKKIKETEEFLGDGIESTHLLFILSIGFSASIIVFAVELSLPKIRTE